MNGRAIHHSLSGVGLLLVFGGLVVIVQQCGCSPKATQAVENSAAVAQYDQLLAKCQTEAAKLPYGDRFAGYIRCEQALSRQLCAESQELRNTWARCKEVLP